MNPNTNIAEFIDQQDTAVAIALIAGLGNFALSQMVSAAQAEVYNRIALERDEENPISVDDRNDKDDATIEREPPYGLENREPPLERGKRYGKLYAACVHRAALLGAGEYDRPQDVAGHITWRAGLPDKELERAGRVKDVTEAIRLASRAKAQRDFWRDRSGDVLEIAEGLVDFDAETAEDALMHLTGVDAVQGMVKGYQRLVDRIMNRKSSPYFTARGPIGDELRSDVGAMEAAKEKVEQFVNTLEREYAAEVLEAINLGRRLDTIDSVEQAVQMRAQERLRGLLASE